jgi:mRNA interferase RelE/StbE
MYQVLFEDSAQKQLRKLDRTVQSRLLKALSKLTLEPRPAGVKQLKNVEDLYRLRSGDYRVLYRIKDDQLRILVVALAHRREVYQSI